MSREVPQDWLETEVGEITEIQIGGTPSRAVPSYWAQNGEEGLPWLSIADMRAPDIFRTKERITASGAKNSNVKLIKPDTVLMSFKLSIGKVALARVPLYTNEAIAAFIPNTTRLENSFLRYALPHFVGHVETDQAVKGVTLNKAKLKSLVLPLPPVQEQRRIAEILSSVDEAIAATRAVIEQTRKVKQGVLERLLTKGIGHTQIGEIPEGWRTGKIGDFFTLQRGFDITEKQSTVGEYPVVSSSGISYFHWEAMVRGPAVITGRKGKLGQVYFIDSSCWPHDTTLWVKDFKGNAPKFVYWFLRSLNLEKFDAATAVPTLNRNVVHALGCAFPPISEQLLIADHLDSIEATEDTQTRNLASYGQTKSALMADLLTGRKRVTDALPMAAE